MQVSLNHCKLEYFYKIIKHVHTSSIYFAYRFEIKLIRPMVCEKGQRFTFRDGSTTLGTGVITNILQSLTVDERTLLLEGKKKRQKMAEQ